MRDFVGPIGRRGLFGADGPPGQSIVGPQGPPGSDANVPEWVTTTQLDVQLIAFGGTLAASRITNIDYNSLINKPIVVLPGFLPPPSLSRRTHKNSRGFLPGTASTHTQAPSHPIPVSNCSGSPDSRKRSASAIVWASSSL